MGLCAGSPCTPPFLGGVCGVRVCALVLYLPRPSWLALVVCVFVCRFCLVPANEGWGFYGYVCALVLPLPCQSLLAFVVCVFVCGIRRYPAIPGLGY